MDIEDREPTLFEAIRIIAHGITDDIKEAQLLGKESRVAELCDSYGQFMCDASQEMLVRAKAIDQLVTKYPDCRREISALAKSFRDASQTYSALYTSFEKQQREGRVPTSLPDFL